MTIKERISCCLHCVLPGNQGIYVHFVVHESEWFPSLLAVEKIFDKM